MMKALNRETNFFVVQHKLLDVEFLGQLLKKMVLDQALSVLDQLAHTILRVLQIEVEAAVINSVQCALSTN